MGQNLVARHAVIKCPGRVYWIHACWVVSCVVLWPTVTHQLEQLHMLRITQDGSPVQKPVSFAVVCLLYL